MGVEHGLYCVGCCWGLMIVLFSLGVMSLVWMAVIAGVIFAEKVFPFGERLTRVSRSRSSRSGSGSRSRRAASRASPTQART